jgi:hypothetical protein
MFARSRACSTAEGLSLKNDNAVNHCSKIKNAR